MDKILIPVLIVAGIGLLAGIILAVASVVMAVPKDEKAEAILEVLPGRELRRVRLFGLLRLCGGPF